MASNAKKPLLDVGTVSGFASARSGLAIPQGLVSLLNDWRLDDGTLRLRYGGPTINAAIDGNNVFRGAASYLFGGVPTLFWAGRLGAATTVEKSIDGGVTWTVITPSAGTYGDTRFPADAPVWFALVNDGGQDYLVMQNGVNDPRIYDGTTTIRAGFAPLVPVVSAERRFTSLTSWVDIVPLVVTDSDTSKLDGTMKESASGRWLELAVTTTVTATATTVVSSPSAKPLFVTAGEPGQMVWMVDTPDAMWRSLKIEASINAGTGGPWFTVYDPTTSTTVTEPVAGNVVLVGSDTGVNAPQGAYSDIMAVRFTYVGPAPAATSTLKVYFVGQAGVLDSGVNYGAAFAASPGNVSGAGMIVKPPTPQTNNGFTIPASEYFGYAYYLNFLTPAALALPLNKTDLFRNVPGQTGYYFVRRFNSPAGVQFFFTDGGDRRSLDPQDLTRPLPRADALAVPIGTTMEVSNGRLFVGAKERTYYSMAGVPFSFARNVEFVGAQQNPDSAGSFAKPGETVSAIVGIGSVLTGTESAGTPLTGAVTIYVIYSGTTYVLSGYDALSLNKTSPICVGSRSPFSVGRADGGFYFLDSDRQVRRVSGVSSSVLSKNTVDDVTQGIPNALLASARGSYSDGRYRLALALVGGTENTRVLVFNEARNAFESLDRPSVAPYSVMPYYDPTLSRTRILVFGAKSLAEIESPGVQTDPGGVAIVGKVVFPELKAFADFNTLSGSFYILSDVDPTGTATFAIRPTTGHKAGIVLPYGPVSLAAPPTRPNETRAARATTTNVGADSLTVVPTLDVSAKGGTRVYTVSGEFAQGTPGSSR